MSEKLYDLSQLNALAAGSEDFVQSMVETFLEHTPGQLEEMKAAYAAGDLTTVGSVAHKLKPNIDLFNIGDITNEIRIIEERGKASINDEQMGQSMSKVSEILMETFKQMKAL